MKPADETYVIVAKVGSPYGVKGWVKIQAYTQWNNDLINYLPWYIQNKNQAWKPLQVENSRLHHKQIVVKINAFDSPETVKALSGKLIAIHRSQLPKLAKNEFYWSQLEGLTVINAKGQSLGKVIYLLSTGSNDVLVIQTAEGKEHAIPYLLNSVIKEVNLDKKEIHIDWELI